MLGHKIGQGQICLSFKYCKFPVIPTSNSFELLKNTCEYCTNKKCNCHLIINDCSTDELDKNLSKNVINETFDDTLCYYDSINQTDLSQTRTEFSSIDSYNDETINDIETARNQNEQNDIYDLSTLFDSNVSDDKCNSVYNDLTHVENISSSMCAESSLNLKLTTKGFTIGHINIQGLQNKFDQIDLMLNNSKMKFIYLDSVKQS